MVPIQGLCSAGLRRLPPFQAGRKNTTLPPFTTIRRPLTFWDEVLKDLDVVVASVHYNRNLPRERQTERILKAMDNPFVDIFAHPTGRLLSGRAPYEVDLEAVMRKAKEVGCFLEINAHPDRLDLSDRYCRMAKELGVKMAISTDAHHASSGASWSAC